MPFIRPVHDEGGPRLTRSAGRLRPRGKGTGVPSSYYLDIKVVPGARREQISGLLGKRLKVRVSAPPEGGKANKAVCRLVAKALGIKASAVGVIAGKSSAEKTLLVEGVAEALLRERLLVDR